jgi:hypothetical protein
MKFLTDILHFALRILQNMANVMETIQNKYKVWHDNIIANGKKRKLIGYKEVHHILPKSLGGSNDKSNLVELTAREHFLVHLLLCKFTKGQAKRSMLYAFKCMCYYKKDGRDYKINSRIAQKLRSELKFSKKHLDNLRKSHLGIRPSKETRLKMSKIHKGNKYCLGKKTSKETKQKLSEIRKQLIWVNNNIQSKRIKKDDIQNYLNIGYKLGRDKSYLTKEYSLKMSKLTQSYWDRRSA